MELASPDGAKGMDEDMDGCQHDIISPFLGIASRNCKHEAGKKNSFKTLSWNTFVAAVGVLSGITFFPAKARYFYRACTELYHTN